MSAHVARRLLASNISERRSLCAGSAPGRESGTDRVAAWAKQQPFDRVGLWRQRLDSDQLTPDGLATLLSWQPSGAELDLPNWYVATARIPSRRRSSLHIDVRDEYKYFGVAEPLVAAAVEQVRAHLAEAENLIAPGCDLFRGLTDSLVRQVNAMAMRVVILELNIARLRGELAGEDSHSRYLAYMQGLREPTYQARLYESYPVLVRQVYLAAQHWACNVGEVLHRLELDVGDLLVLSGSTSQSTRCISGITLGLGDRHRGGRTVARVAFRDGASVIYKPRDPGLDVHLSEFVAWLNASGLTHALRVPRLVAREGYFWQEEIAHTKCKSDEEVHRFYFREGALLACAYLLCATDLHAENIIAAGEHPVLIDVESFLQPSLNLHGRRMTPLEADVRKVVLRSVMRTGLLPNRTWEGGTDPGSDMSGIGATADQPTRMRYPTVVDDGTDLVRVILDEGRTAPALNQPITDFGSHVLVSHMSDVENGFSEAYRIFLQHSIKLLDDNGPIYRFANDQSRIIVRNTMHYGLLATAAYHPSVMRDAMDRERLLDQLWTDVDEVPDLASLVPFERRDLWQNDIPVFTATVSDVELRASDGSPIPGLIDRSAFDHVSMQVRELSEQDLERQRGLIRLTLATRATDLSAELAYPCQRPPTAPGSTATNIEALLRAADNVGQHLARISFQTGLEATWLGVNSRRGLSWSVGPVGPDLYHGLAGIAVFLSALFDATGDEQYVRLATKALHKCTSQAARGVLDGVGGLSGLPGFLYAYITGTVFLDQELDVPLLLYLLSRIEAHTSVDREYDLNSGSAGTILALRHVASLPAGHESAYRILSDAANALLDGQEPATGGWLPESFVRSRLADRPLAGLAHGAAGPIWALAEVSKRLDTAKYETAIRRGLRYEESLYDTKTGGWKDVRDPAVARTDDGESETPLAVWCHGSAGITLSRCRLLALRGPNPAVERTVRSGVQSTIDYGFGQNHSLCHGELGNLDILAEAATLLDSAGLSDKVEKLRITSLSAGIEHGWLCGMPRGVETPGMMTGLAGIGYSLLRLTDPARYPSIVALDSVADPTPVQPR